MEKFLLSWPKSLRNVRPQRSRQCAAERLAGSWLPRRQQRAVAFLRLCDVVLLWAEGLGGFASPHKSWTRSRAAGRGPGGLWSDLLLGAGRLPARSGVITIQFPHRASSAACCSAGRAPAPCQKGRPPRLDPCRSRSLASRRFRSVICRAVPQVRDPAGGYRRLEGTAPCASLRASRRPRAWPGPRRAGKHPGQRSALG